MKCVQLTIELITKAFEAFCYKKGVEFNKKDANKIFKALDEDEEVERYYFCGAKCAKSKRDCMREVDEGMHCYVHDPARNNNKAPVDKHTERSKNLKKIHTSKFVSSDDDMTSEDEKPKKRKRNKQESSDEEPSNDDDEDIIAEKNLYIALCPPELMGKNLPAPEISEKEARILDKMGLQEATPADVEKIEESSADENSDDDTDDGDTSDDAGSVDDTDDGDTSDDAGSDDDSSDDKDSDDGKSNNRPDVESGDDTSKDNPDEKLSHKKPSKDDEKKTSRKKRHSEMPKNAEPSSNVDDSKDEKEMDILERSMLSKMRLQPMSDEERKMLFNDDVEVEEGLPVEGPTDISKMKWKRFHKQQLEYSKNVLVNGKHILKIRKQNKMNL
ncbi:hypothetical protein KI688_010525 [Linnemannia hyalina]|uniref:Uncharacterized protein n=1 Tax=Linnemannia hyalina TaxID=64524 RepID=A0A9P7XYQ2_9FUNG|nr:hypothetical protein KI688_010525 [Linnemannia hyalina]